MLKHWKIVAVFMLSGCTTPFADRIAYDPQVRNAEGTITLSAPKLYTREALISERARDVKWINGLIKDSEDSAKVVFKPELVREVEQITSMAAAIGLKFDPTSELAYRRNKEAGDIQHEMSVLKLQLQLDQLKRDVELAREKFDSQTELVNEGLGKLGDSATQGSESPSPTATDQLKLTIEKLTTSLTSRLDAEGKSAAVSTVTSSPFDDFRDRSAYRDMLKAAQNSAGLDQLHDFNSGRLTRLNFQASVLPDSSNLQSLGAIQVSVVAPTHESKEMRDFFQHWLEYINTNKDYRSDAKLNTQNPSMQSLLLSGLFEKVDVLGVEVLLPITEDIFGRSDVPSNIYRRSSWDTANTIDDTNYEQAISALSSIDKSKTDKTLTDLCNGSAVGGGSFINMQVQEADDRLISIGYIQLANMVAHSIGKPTVLTNDITAKINRAANLREQALNLMFELPQCDARSEYLRRAITWKVLSDTVLPRSEKIRIYEIGPREQVQQISTVARSANSLALAASIAAANPGSGVGAEAAASYSRQTMGRATAIERVPSVVGYSQTSDSVFGWVLGPHAVLNARGRIDMEQLLKTYDLFVDMSVPGWWPSLTLMVTTAWAPSPALIASGNLPIGRNHKQIVVPLASNSADKYDSLTQYFTGDDRSVVIQDIKGGPVNACDKSNLLITGANIWRAKQIVVLGQVLEEDAITISADMKGILLSVPPVIPLKNGNNSKALYVITPLGMSKPKDVEYISDPSGESCKPKKPNSEEAPKDAVSISELTPQEFVIPSNVRINIAGTNLSKIVAVQLAGQPAKTVEPASDGKSLVVVFEEGNTKSIHESDNAPLKFFEKDKTTGKPSTTASVTKYVRIHR